jgi:hypothetical protein
MACFRKHVISLQVQHNCKQPSLLILCTLNVNEPSTFAQRAYHCEPCPSNIQFRKVVSPKLPLTYPRVAGFLVSVPSLFRAFT